MQCMNPQKFVGKYVKILIAKSYNDDIWFPIQTIQRVKIAKLFCIRNHMPMIKNMS